MSPLHQRDFQNKLLRLLTDVDFTTLVGYLEPIELPRHFVFALTNRITEHTYFLESGICSVVVRSSTGLEAEVCIIGSDGMVPPTSVLGATSVPFEITMQTEGLGYRIETAQLIAAYNASVSLRGIINRYIHTAAVQTAYSAFSNANHQIEQRLARWILMCHDRSLTDTIRFTHASLSEMLAVRRQSITTCLHLLEGKQLVRSLRGAIVVRDRAGLEELASDAYGVPEHEYNQFVKPDR